MLFMLLPLALLSIGCNESQSKRAGPEMSKVVENAEIDLAIVGYNYTNRGISILSVDGVGGGNIALSGTKGGGGGIACCVKYKPGSTPSHHVIRWDVGSCRYHEAPRSEWGEIFALHYYYEEKQVEVSSQSSVSPSYFEVHFLPDGSVKVQVTAELSAPMIALPDGRKETRSPQCPGNVRPPRTF